MKLKRESVKPLSIVRHGQMLMVQKNLKYTLVEKLNATAPENLAKAMKEANGWLVQISTDYVFGGDLTTLLARKTSKEHQPVYMEPQNFWASKK